MKAVAGDRYGSPAVLLVEEVPGPSPDPQQVLVMVEIVLGLTDTHTAARVPRYRNRVTDRS